MSVAKLPAWWFHRQGLDGSFAGKSAAEVLAASGWARSVGGAGPYIGLFGRVGLSREAVDASMAALEIHELPAARGCTYVLPASDFALGLKVGQAFGGADMKTAHKLGVSASEIDKLCDAVLVALKKGPLDPEQLREATGGAARSLGPDGQKKGLSSTMPVALGRLQNFGEIRRVPMDGRLDRQRYRYALWKPNPLAAFRLSAEEAYAELARRYFRWIGPATLAEFQWFSGLGVKAAKEATGPLKLVPFEGSDERWMFEEDREAFRRWEAPKKPQYNLVSSLDAMTLLRRNLSLLIAAADLERNVPDGNGTRPMGGLADLPSHAILDRGRIAGLWEFDTATATLAWTAFARADAALKEAAARMEEFVRAQLGDARSFSLDSPKSRAPKIAALRRMQG